MPEEMRQKKMSLEYFKNLIAIANADGHLDENEKKFLAEKAKEFDLPTDEVQTVIENADKLHFTIPSDRLSREEHLADIVFMSMVDGELAKQEYNLCLKIAEHLDMKKRDVDQI